MDHEEAIRVIKILAKRPWVKVINPIPAGWLLVETTDGIRWKITSPLAYARLLYSYECNKRAE